MRLFAAISQVFIIIIIFIIHNNDENKNLAVGAQS